MSSPGKCIRESGNWSKLKKSHRFDDPTFSKEEFNKDLVSCSPKLQKLLKNIKELDEADLKNHGHTFKHFIYSDIKSAYGAKLISSALSAYGLDHAYKIGQSARGMSFHMNKDLKNTFATLTSVSFFDKPIGVNFRKELLKTFNNRPSNIHGSQIRFIILDSGFREGIDLFDIKYVHIFEPLLTRSDEKQAIGRATRFCGQKGLTFVRNKGWPLHVFKYETVIPHTIRASLLSDNKSLEPSNTFFDLFLRFSNIDPKKINFANDLEPLVILSAVDRFLTRNVHNFSIKEDPGMPYYEEIMKGGTLTRFQKTQSYVRKTFSKYEWPHTRIENGCNATQESNSLVTFTPSQDFVRHYFNPKNPYKGLLLMHSVGCGKTCSAIAIGSTSFEKEGYTILYVTRHTLKSDVWKNMFGLSCNVFIQDMIKKGVPIPEAEAKKKKLIEAWLEPMSYKQFSNMLLGKNAIYDTLEKRNGKKDILKKTLVIIDEAHKLFAQDVVGTEKPDIDAIRKAFHHSYVSSKKDSARLLLMTATPYTDDPMDMTRIINLMLPPSEQLPEDFDAFSKTYLDNDGHFTEQGKNDFVNHISGLISYLNRERDVRSFAYPVFEKIEIPLSSYEFNNELKDYGDTLRSVKSYSETLQNLKIDTHREGINKKIDLTKKHENELKILYDEYNECIENEQNNKQHIKDNIQETYKQNIRVCTDIKKQCEEKAKTDNKKQISDTREKGKGDVTQCRTQCKEAIKTMKENYKQELKKCKRGDTQCREEIKNKISQEQDALKIDMGECIENVKNRVKNEVEMIKDDVKFDIKECASSEEYKDCNNKAQEEKDKALEDLKNNTKCKKLKEEYEKRKTEGKKDIEEKVNKYLEKQQKQIDFDQKVLDTKTENLRKLKDTILQKSETDQSQQGRLEHCLSKQNVKPLYKKILSGQTVDYFDDELANSPIPSSVDANVYLVNGHGSENIVDFKKRVKLPEDKILVVFPVCGRPNWMNIVCLFMDIFNDPKNIKLMTNPVKYQKQIEKLLGYDVRVYLPGSKIPQMSTNLFFNFELEKTVLLKSGVFRLCNVPPIDRKRLKEINNPRLFLGDVSCKKYIGMVDEPSAYSGQTHHEVFKGNIMPEAGKRESYNTLVRRNFTISEIMEKVGPGIYFYTGCRSSRQNIPDEKYEALLENSAKQQEGKHKRTAMENFKKKHLKFTKVSNSESSSQSQRSSSQTSDSQSSTDANSVKNSSSAKRKDDLKIMKSYIKKAKSYFDNLFEISNTSSTINDLEDMIENMNNLEEGDFKTLALRQLQDILSIYRNKDNYSRKVSIYKRKGYHIVVVERIYKMGSKTYKVLEKEYGKFEAGKKDFSQKCRSETLVARIKKIYKLGKLDLLKFGTSFEELCIESRNLLVSTNA